MVSTRLACFYGVLFNNVFHTFHRHSLDVVNVALAVAPLAAIGIFSVHIKKLEASFGIGFLVAFTRAFGRVTVAWVMYAKLSHCETLQAQLTTAFWAAGFANPLLVALATALALGGNAGKCEANKFSSSHGVDDVENVIGGNGNDLLLHCSFSFIQGCLPWAPLEALPF